MTGRTESRGLIDTHAHYLPRTYCQALTDEGLREVDGVPLPLPPWSLDDHLAKMNANNIGTSILSLSSPNVQFVSGRKAALLSRAVNEAGAEIVRAHPGRFGLFASLPLPDVEASLAEIDYAFDSLGVDGVVLMTNIRGHYLGHRDFIPVFQALDGREAVIYLHPTSPCGLGAAGMGLPKPVIEFPFDTVRSAVNLIYSGVLNTCPRIKILLSHAGGALPMLASRIAAIAELPLIDPRPARGSDETLERIAQFYYDLALSATPLALNALREITSIDHIMFGTDFPFSGELGFARSFSAFAELTSRLSPEDCHKLTRGNALALFPRLAKMYPAGRSISSA